jgi:hypothetical protein
MVLRMSGFASPCLQIVGLFRLSLQTAFGSTRLAEQRGDFNAAFAAGMRISTEEIRNVPFMH